MSNSNTSLNNNFYQANENFLKLLNFNATLKNNINNNDLKNFLFNFISQQSQFSELINKLQNFQNFCSIKNLNNCNNNFDDFKIEMGKEENINNIYKNLLSEQEVQNPILELTQNSNPTISSQIVNTNQHVSQTFDFNYNKILNSILNNSNFGSSNNSNNISNFLNTHNLFNNPIVMNLNGINNLNLYTNNTLVSAPKTSIQYPSLSYLSGLKPYNNNFKN
jgi:hypothetical protein